MSPSAFALWSALALAMQRPALEASRPKPVPSASISGVVVRHGTGEAVPNVTVTLAKTDVPKGVSGYLREVLGGTPDGLKDPPAERSLSVEFFENMRAEAGFTDGRLPPGMKEEDVGPEFALLRLLPVETLDTVLIDPSGKVGVVSKNVAPVLTDGVGHFSFQNLEPGTYRLIFAINGFVRQDYGARALGGAGTPIVLKAAEAVDGLVMPMIPTGAISGRVTGGNGQPIASAPVRLLRLGYDVSGKVHTQTIDAAETDDRGEYRFYFLTPGRYYIKAGGLNVSPDGEFSEVNHAPGFYDFPSGNGPNRAFKTYTPTFYPRAGDASSATPVEVAPGADVEGIDIAVTAQRYYAIRGWVVDNGTGSPSALAAVGLSIMKKGGPEESYRGGAQYNPADGTFEFPGLTPGTYSVLATINPGSGVFPDAEEAARRAMSPAEREKYNDALMQAIADIFATSPRGIATVTVGNADADGIEIRLIRSLSISARVRVEADGAPHNSQVHPGLRLLGIGMLLVGESTDSPKRDGSLRIGGLLPGEYRLEVLGLPQGFYVKSAKFDGKDATGRQIAVSAETPGALEVVIGFGSGQIAGVVTAAGGQPVSGVQAVLIPEGNSSRTELFRTVTAEADGRFSLTNVTPGDYRLVAWEFLEPYGYFDPALLAQAREKGKAVRVGESSKQDVTIGTLPLPE